MNKNDIPMVHSGKSSLPVVYGDTRRCFGVLIGSMAEYDVPWEGSVTWGTYSGCELAPPEHPSCLSAHVMAGSCRNTASTSSIT